MRPYGLEHKLIAGPDVGDVQGQARKSSVGQFPGKGGHCHGYTRSTAAKRATRVSIKRGARTDARRAVARELANLG